MTRVSRARTRALYLRGPARAASRPPLLRDRCLAAESGQAIVLLLGVAAAVLLGALVLAALGQGLVGKGRHQRAADLAAISAAHAMRDAYPRLLAPARLRGGRPNPRHLDRAAFVELARTAAVRIARRNGFRLEPDDVRFAGGDGLVPLRVTTVVRGAQELSLAGGPSAAGRPSVAVRGRATAEVVPLATGDLAATGGEYSGPLAYRQGKPMRPDVAQAFDRMEAAAARDGVTLTITSAFRSDAEQARLFAANPDPKWVARPGTSLHRNGTELDLGPESAYDWLARNGRRFGFVQRYSWEPWHYGYVHNPGSSSLGFGRAGVHDGGGSAVPAFAPPEYRAAIVAAARRWKVSAALIAAQLEVESGFDPRAVSSAGAQGIAQFMPGTAAAYGLSNPFDAEAAIDAQAHLMHDLLRRFGSVPLALAAYNAGEGAVGSCGCIPPYAETRAYVARILALIGAQGLAGALEFEVRLVD